VRHHVQEHVQVFAAEAKLVLIKDQHIGHGRPSSVGGQRNRPDVKRLGNPNGARALKGRQVGNKETLTVIKAHAQQRAQNLRAIVADLRGAGTTSIRAIADELNRRAILTPRGGQWHPTSVMRLLKRLA
jgi:hypothetical protein